MNELCGTYRITMVLPAWTVENELTLIPKAGGALGGRLDTMNGEAPVGFTHARWNGPCFQIALSVGPGALQLTGRVEGDRLTGVVVMEDTPDRLSGIRISGKETRTIPDFSK